MCYAEADKWRFTLESVFRRRKSNIPNNHYRYHLSICYSRETRHCLVSWELPWFTTPRYTTTTWDNWKFQFFDIWNVERFGHSAELIGAPSAVATGYYRSVTTAATEREIYLAYLISTLLAIAGKINSTYIFQYASPTNAISNRVVHLVTSILPK